MSDPCTYILDLDGTLVVHEAPETRADPNHVLTVLPGVCEKLQAWRDAGNEVIIATGREECLRAATVEQLWRAGLKYDQLVMGLTRGVRVLINDRKPDGEVTAVAYSPARDLGIAHIDE